jgi:Domain of unknown function (DUF4167)
MRNGQGGGRRGRRNRGGQPGISRPIEQGNRNDARVRGNAHQLMEKYKTLARDAQMAGDRILSEYYMQHADHYFRVLAEHRSRYEDQRPREAANDSMDEADDDDDTAEVPQAGFGAAAAVQAFGVDGVKAVVTEEPVIDAQAGLPPVEAAADAGADSDEDSNPRRRRGRRPRRPSGDTADQTEAPADVPADAEA